MLFLEVALHSRSQDSYRGVVFALSRTVETVTMWIVFVAMGQAWTVDNGDAVVA